MRCLHRAVAFFLPSLAASLVIPADPLPAARESAPESVEGNWGAIFEYNELQQASVKFSLPCDECEDEEKERFEEQTFTVALPSHEDLSCSQNVDTGIRLNGHPLGAAQLDFNNHRRWAHPSHLHLNSSISQTYNADWELVCACTTDWAAHGEQYHSCPEYGYNLAFQFKLGEEKPRRTGFTLTYDQHTSPNLIRFSPFVEDISSIFDGISLESIHQTRHWASPNLLPVSFGIHAGHLPSAEEPYLSTFTTSTILQDATGTPYTQATSTQAWPAASTPLRPVAKIGSNAIDDTAAIPESAVLASNLNDDIDSSDSHDSPTKSWSTYEFQVRLHSEHIIEAVKHGLVDLEDHAHHAAQAVMKQLKNHLPDCSHKEQLSEAAKASKTSALGAIETRDSSAESGVSTTSSHPDSSNSNFNFRAFQITSGIILLLTVSGGIYAYVRRDPRIRAEIATQCEERRTKRLYRHAARKQKFRAMWEKLRGRRSEIRTYMMPHSPTDPAWEEKEKGFTTSPAFRYMYPQSEGLSEGLEGMRKAHRFVDGILRGRGEGSSKASARQTRHHRRYSLPESEKSIPPTYEASSADTVVVDGVSFVSHTTMVDGSSDSSVVDTSSRHSCYGSSDDEKE